MLSELKKDFVCFRIAKLLEENHINLAMRLHTVKASVRQVFGEPHGLSAEVPMTFQLKDYIKLSANHIVYVKFSLSFYGSHVSSPICQGCGSNNLLFFLKYRGINLHKASRFQSYPGSRQLVIH